jgi:peptidoglycan hydrolase-like protein with peptidoglycan-binding domain
VRIDPAPADSYAAARGQGRAEAAKTVGVAQSLGISAGSTLWYDIESFPTAGTDCRESALSFLSAWTNRLHTLGYVSGVYSSASTGIKILDDARATRPGSFSLPDRVWIADWNLRRDVFSTFVRDDGWMPHQRVHQYRGGHPETHGGVTIEVDNNWVDLGTGSTIAREPLHCGGAAAFNFPSYPTRRVGDTGALVRTVQCLVREKGFYTGAVDGVYDAAVGSAVRRWRVGHGLSSITAVGPSAWVALLSEGTSPLLKYGAASPAVRRLQRALNAADAAALPVTGVFADRTRDAVARYQADHGLARTGVVTASVWTRLLAGTR